MLSNNDWENLQNKFFLRAQALLVSLNSIPFPKHDLLIHKCLFHTLTFGRVREYSQVVHILAPSTSSNPTLTLITLHLEPNGYILLFLKDYKPDQDLKLLLIPSNWHPNTCRIYRQVVFLGWFLNTFEIVFILKIQWVDSFNCSNFVFILHKVTFHLKLHIFEATHHLAMTKPSSEVCYIIMGEVLYQHTNCTLCF